MRPQTLTVAAVAVGILAAGCASTGSYGGGASVATGYDGYYDDFYGPFDNGYWAPDGFFHFAIVGHRGFRRDDGHHFRHEAANGFHSIRGHETGQAVNTSARTPAPAPTAPTTAMPPATPAPAPTAPTPPASSTPH